MKAYLKTFIEKMWHKKKRLFIQSLFHL
jgi:hypothetical protein